MNIGRIFEGVSIALDSLRANKVRAALTNGQVHELLITAAPAAIGRAEGAAAADLVEQLVAQARQTSAVVHFIEDRALLEPVGGIAARLRYRVGGIAA